jgi:Transcriptional regulator
MNKSALKKRETIDKILQAAAKEIQTKGIDSARISVIAAEAGVTKQLVYHYFETKDHMYVSILESAAEGMRLTKNVDIYQTLEPSAAIELIIDTIFTGFAKNPSYTVLALDQALHHGDHISPNNDFTASMKDFIEQVFPQILQRGQHRGVFRKDLEPELTFWMIFNLVASYFLNNNIMQRVTQADYESPQALEQWRTASVT